MAKILKNSIWKIIVLMGAFIDVHEFIQLVNAYMPCLFRWYNLFFLALIIVSSNYLATRAIKTTDTVIILNEEYGLNV
jgi:hypothetical protein